MLKLWWEKYTIYLTFSSLQMETPFEKTFEHRTKIGKKFNKLILVK